MKYTLTTIFFVFTLVLSSNAQMLAINQPLFSDLPFFNDQFVRQNNIKAIKGSISSKKVQDIIRSNNLDYWYQFNRNGTLQSQLFSHYSEGIKDSTVIFYTYKNGQLKVLRKSDNGGYYSYHYIYNENNDVVTQTYCRDENTFKTKEKFELKKQYTIVYGLWSSDENWRTFSTY